jgi:hypothetical protein
VHPK